MSERIARKRLVKALESKFQLEFIDEDHDLRPTTSPRALLLYIKFWPYGLLLHRDSLFLATTLTLGQIKSYKLCWTFKLTLKDIEKAVRSF